MSKQKYIRKAWKIFSLQTLHSNANDCTSQGNDSIHIGTTLYLCILGWERDLRDGHLRWWWVMMTSKYGKKKKKKMKKTLTNNTITYNNSLTHSGSSWPSVWAVYKTLSFHAVGCIWRGVSGLFAHNVIHIYVLIDKITCIIIPHQCLLAFLLVIQPLTWCLLLKACIE